MQTNYIFVTGGVLSGLGKGITTASIGKILQSRGFTVTAMKIDPYLNYDAGTLRPTEHGEVWVTDDGGEIDQDLGHYERFLNINISKKHNITTGQIYSAVIERERRGEYLGKTVQPIPHITDEIKKRIREVAKNTKADFVLIEIGGTVGDYENIMFLEAARHMKLEDKNVLFVHVAYLPVVGHLGEMKSKPLQHSVKELREFGIQADFIVCRSEHLIDKVRKDKIALYCNILKEQIISNPDVGNVYEIPLTFEQQKFSDKILEKLNLKAKKTNLNDWKKFIERAKNAKQEIKIGIVGKYFDIGLYKLPDAYISVIEAIKHSAWQNNRKPKIEWIDSKQFEDDKKKLSILKNLDGVIVPGGFGSGGIEGKILTIQYAREKNIPYLGLCLGLQLSVVEFARNVCKLKNANSTEINPKTPYPVIDILPEQKKIMENSDYGATMRLGNCDADLKRNTLVWNLYDKKNSVKERHRHRYEVNPDFHEVLQKNGLIFSGTSHNGRLVEFVELPKNSYFCATQSHPEFTSRPLRPNPLFDGFIKSAIKKK